MRTRRAFKTIAGKLEVQGIVPRSMTPDEMRAFVAGEIAKFGAIFVRAKIHA